MSTDLEARLRSSFTERANGAPEPSAALASVARGKVRRQRAVRTGFVALALAALAPVAVHGLTDESPAQPTVKMPSQPPGQGSTGPVDIDSTTASCAEEYSPQTLADRAYAFDGTVVAITSPPARAGDPRGYAQVTFMVGQWFRGGSAESADVLMAPPTDGPSIEDRQAYAVGTRLLVSGEFLRNGQPIAWGCGFLRYHSEADAQAWSNALK